MPLEMKREKPKEEDRNPPKRNDPLKKRKHGDIYRPKKNMDDIVFEMDEKNLVMYNISLLPEIHLEMALNCSGRRDSLFWKKTRSRRLLQFDEILFLEFKEKKSWSRKKLATISSHALVVYKCGSTCVMDENSRVALSASRAELVTRVRLALSHPCCWVCLDFLETIFVGHWGQTVSNYQLQSWSSFFGQTKSRPANLITNVRLCTSTRLLPNIFLQSSRIKLGLRLIITWLAQSTVVRNPTNVIPYSHVLAEQLERSQWHFEQFAIQTQSGRSILIH